MQKVPFYAEGYLENGWMVKAVASWVVKAVAIWMQEQVVEQKVSLSEFVLKIKKLKTKTF